MAENGKAIVFISHKMQEVLNLANEIDILRRGKIVDSFLREDVPGERELASRMVGREMLQTVRPRRRNSMNVCFVWIILAAKPFRISI